jgi:glycosyltransferase involved in cell wall biosynthesis
MRILIDFTNIPLKKLGVGRYAENLVNFLLKIDERNKYFLLLQNDEFCFKDKSVKKIYVPSTIFRNSVLRILLEQLYIPLLLIKYNIDIIHSLHYSFPILPSAAKKVVTIHDMTFFLYPKLHQYFKTIYFKFFINIYVGNVQKIISVSRSTLKDYFRITNAHGNTAKVIHLGKTDWDLKKITPKKISSVKKKYCIDGEYLLSIGTLEPRKNLTKVISAYEKLLATEKKYKLVIAGMTGWKYHRIIKSINSENLKRYVLLIGYFEEKDKPYLLKGAKLLLYPSLYEGFGLPVLEALSLGVPTITSNVSSMPEIAGNSAMLVNPNNDYEILQAMKKLLYNDKVYKMYQEEGLKRARRFNWEKVACETLLQYYYTINGK